MIMYSVVDPEIIQREKKERVIKFNNKLSLVQQESALVPTNT